MGENVNLYAGIELIKASDKTPKHLRVGNYYHKRPTSNGKYVEVVSIERYNQRLSDKGQM